VYSDHHKLCLIQLIMLERFWSVSRMIYQQVCSFCTCNQPTYERNCNYDKL